MLLLQGQKLSKQFADRTLFTIESLSIYSGERIALVGANGVGKSTLLDILRGMQPSDTGSVQRYCDIACIEQLAPADAQAVPDAALAARFGVRHPEEARSGGEIMRAKIAAALSVNSALLFADEPGANLDLQGLEMLQEALEQYLGAIVIVSHDRQLLDALCTCVWELEGGVLREYPGNYTQYAHLCAQRRAREQDQYRQYVDERRRLEGLARETAEKASGMRHLPKRMGASERRLHKNAPKSQQKLESRAKALRSRAQQLEEQPKPNALPQVRLALGSRPWASGRFAVEAHALTLQAGAHTLLADAAFTVLAQQRTALVGPNGCGKTTLIRALQAGAQGLRISPAARTAFFMQSSAEDFNKQDTMLQAVLRTSDRPQDFVRLVLARMGFRGDAVFKPMHVLSGGERVKVALARLLVSDANVLIMDEPTNYLDIYAMEALEELLREYPGTLLFVSHDRRFIDSVAQRLLIFEGGTLVEHEGNWSDYTARRVHRQTLAQPPNPEAQLRDRLRDVISALSAARTPQRREELEEKYQALLTELSQYKDRR